MILHDLKAVFVHIPKVAGTSIEYALDPTKKDPYLTNHRTLAEEVKLSSPDYYRFTFIRNPWGRMWSHYNFLLKGEHTSSKAVGYIPESFKDFCMLLDMYDLKLMAKSQSFFLQAHLKGKLPLDFIGRYETLEEDFAKVAERLGMPGTTLPHLREQPLDDYRDHYDDTTRKIVAWRYAEDIDNFGYTFDK